MPLSGTPLPGLSRGDRLAPSSAGMVPCSRAILCWSSFWLLLTQKLCYVPVESESPSWSQTGRGRQHLWPQLRTQCSRFQGHMGSLGAVVRWTSHGKSGRGGSLGIIFYLDVRRPCYSLLSLHLGITSSVLFFPRLLQEQTHFEERQLGVPEWSGLSRHLFISLWLQPHFWETSGFVNNFFGKF